MSGALHTLNQDKDHSKEYIEGVKSDKGLNEKGGIGQDDAV